MNNLLSFVLAGKAIFTVTSKSSGQRFTFKVTQPSENAPHFVTVLTGADNTNNYSTLGTIFDGRTYRHNFKKGKIGVTAPSAQAFDWFIKKLINEGQEAVERQANVCHCGRCGRCGRLLTVPESVESGFGPECAAMMGN